MYSNFIREDWRIMHRYIAGLAAILLLQYLPTYKLNL